MTAPIPTLSGLSEIAEGRDLILCDVWGVLHDGQTAHGAAGEALIRFRALPGPRRRRVVLVSNAPRPGDGVQRILDRFGVPREAYDGILTSGDLTRDLIAARPGARVRHVGPERDLGVFAGLNPSATSASSRGSTSASSRRRRPTSSSAPACSTTERNRPTTIATS